VALLSGVLALWNYHLAPIAVQICNKDSISALCVYWFILPTGGGVGGWGSGDSRGSILQKICPEDVVLNLILLCGTFY